MSIKISQKLLNNNISSLKRTTKHIGTQYIRTHTSTSNDKKKIGFIGLGRMGAHMAINVHKSLNIDDSLYVYDLNKSVYNDIKKTCDNNNNNNISINYADDIKEISKNCNYIITMLPNSSHVVETLETNIFKYGNKDTLIIDCSTIDPNISKSLSDKALKYNMKMLDAPVSGGVTGAEAGTLTFMVGGEEYNLESAKFILNAMGKNIVHCGPNGSGEVAKLCNNLALAIEMIGVSEALALGKAHGMDPKLLSSIMNTSTARCWSSDTYNPAPGVIPTVPSSNDYNGGFGVNLMTKDLHLAMDSIQNNNTFKEELRAGLLATNLYSEVNQSYPNKDFSIVYKILTDKLE